MRKNENAGGGYLKNLKNPLALLLSLSLVSCHPAPAIAAEPVVFCIGHDVCDTHAEAARRADDLLRQTPAAICASIRREVRR